MASCSDSSSTSSIDGGGDAAKDAAGVDADADVVVPTGGDAGDGGDTCPTGFIVPGAACASNGATATGPAPECTDIGTRCPVAATCTCTAGTWVCPRCAHCAVMQGALGCGIGQVCGGITLTQCDGTTREIASDCSCSLGFRGLECGTEEVHFGCDAGSDGGDGG
jgi:hypothetical protein